MPGGEVGYSVEISIEHGYGNHESYPLVDTLGPVYRTEGGSFDGISDVEDS